MYVPICCIRVGSQYGAGIYWAMCRTSCGVQEIGEDKKPNNDLKKNETIVTDWAKFPSQTEKSLYERNSMT